MGQKTWEPFIQVRTGQLLKYELPKEGFNCPSWRKPPSRKGYQGEVTASTAKRIRTAVDIFLQVSPKRFIFNPVTEKRQLFQLSFITLTIPQEERILAPEGHKALKVFLQHFKKPWHKRKMSEQVRSYIWKAELQERGQLHYHITTNSFLHHVEIRRVWNDIQKARGWLDSFKMVHGHYNPNSTDVHAVQKINDIKRYLSKYLSKPNIVPAPELAEAGFPALYITQSIGGKVWGCSEDLKGKKLFSAPFDGETWDNILDAHGNGNLTVRPCDRCEFYDLKTKKPELLLSPLNQKAYDKWKI